MSESSDRLGTGIHSSEKREVMRSVTTSLDAVRQDAALAANMNPLESDVVDAGVTDDGELKLYLEGEEL